MEIRAVVFPEADRFELRTLHLPEPGPGDILVRTLVSAISPGTERWILRGKHIGTRFPCVPGYHRVGVVEHCGPEVQGFAPDTIVYGSGNRWLDKDVISMWGAHVGHSVSAPAGYHVLARQALPREALESVAFTILCGVSNRGINRCDVCAGQQTLHLGAGIVGVCAAQLAARRGAVPVLLDRDPERIAHVSRAFPDIPVFSVDDAELIPKLKAHAPSGFDLLQDTVGHAPTTDRLVPLVRSQGTLLLQAQYFDRQSCAVDLDQIKIRELTVRTTCGIREEDWQQTSAALLSGALNMQALITHRLPAARLLDAFGMLHTGKPHNLGMVIGWE
ncbi:MAG: zinc-binding dehydrogenase [Lentisphaeria bacterium]|nr:zinc-binding dehydrogenase [Lentisphaeria bacterium]